MTSRQNCVMKHKAACPLTHAGRDVVQTGLQGAAPLLAVVSDVGFQEGHAELPLVHHAYQAASGLTRSFTFTSEHDNRSVQRIHFTSESTCA